MNDRFKFRFFNEYSNKLESCDEYDLKDIFESGNPVMQCTGLKDKNGTLIYEGDIVKVNNVVSTIIFQFGIFGCWFDKKRKDLGRFLGLGAYTVNELEVIGNIYENKELLEEE